MESVAKEERMMSSGLALTVAHIAGTILSGRKHERWTDTGLYDKQAVVWAVELARMVVAEVERTEAQLLAAVEPSSAPDPVWFTPTAAVSQMFKDGSIGRAEYVKEPDGDR